MTDTGAIAGILSKCLKVNVTIKGGNFQARCDHDHLITVLNSSSMKMTLFCFGISVFKKGSHKFVVTNDGTFIGNLYAVNNNDN